MQELIKSSQQVIKESNLKLVFGLIHKQGPISRADIKKMTGLSATTVSSLVEELLADGFVNEGGVKNSTTSGRKAVLLHVNPDGGYFVGIDVQNGAIVADTFALDFTEVDHMKVSTTSNEKIALGILRAISTASREKRILGVTIGLPGVIDTASNTVVSSTVIDAATANDIYQTVAEALPDAKICLRNNSGLIAYAEKEFGNHGEVSSLVSIDIDDGVGAGIILGGSIYAGANGMAGEFGHITVDYRGEKCKCGSYGCLELAASIPAMLAMTAENSIDDLAQSLIGGNQIVIEIIDNVAKALAFGINNILNIVDPEFIVISGSVRALGDYLLTPLKKYIKQIAFVKDKKIEYSSIETNAVTLGGARCSFDEMFGA
ncbi:MAG: ROK family transcriptional regulator [Clostridia bacterium]|nr:ROK family transcriptional regulator [Clostridia bacterium]